MNCLKNLVSAGLRGRYRAAVRPPPPPPTTRCYHASTQRSHEAFQCGRGRLFRRNPVVECRPPPSHALVFPRYFFSRRKKPSDIDRFFMSVAAVVIIVDGVVVCIRDGTFETVPYTNRSHFMVLKPDAELELGESELAKLKKKHGNKILPPSHPDSVRVRDLAKEIISAAHRGLADSFAAANGGKKVWRRRQPQTKHLEGINWEVLVIEEDTVNACCMPGGKIVVYTGLLDKFKTDAEIATVLGHEVGHAIARHIAEGYTKNMCMLMLKSTLILLSDVSVPTEMDDLTTLLFSLPFSRRMEIEADHIGIMLLAAAGFDPHIAPTVYEKLGENSSQKEEYRSTHPSSEKRSRLLSEAKVMDKAMALYREDSASTETEGFFIFSSEKVSFT